MAAAQLKRSIGGGLGAAKPRLDVGRARAASGPRLAGRPAPTPFVVHDRCAILSLLSGGLADGCCCP
jgi:hypothetical protein